MGADAVEVAEARAQISDALVVLPKGTFQEEAGGTFNAGILNGLKNYNTEVKEKTFPQPENWFTIKDEEYDELMDLLD